MDGPILTGILESVGSWSTLLFCFVCESGKGIHSMDDLPVRQGKKLVMERWNDPHTSMPGTLETSRNPAGS
jgi:hypothetical protein